MDSEKLSHSLSVAGIEPAGTEYWVACVQTPQKAQEDFESAAYLDHPFNWYNPKVASFVKRMEIPAETRAYVYMSVLAKLVPEPEKISTWPEMNSLIAELVKKTDFVTKAERRLPINADFLAKFEQRSSRTLEAWNLEFLNGNFWGILAAIARLIRQVGPKFDAWCKPYMDLLARLLTPAPKPDFKEPGKNGLLMLSSHCRFHAEHTKQTRIHFRNRVFIVTGHMVKDEQSTSILPMLMLKALKSGKAVYVAVDGGKGNQSLEASVFECKVSLPSSFTWVTSKTNCDCQWSFLVANRDTAGTQIQSHDLSLLDRKEVSYEDFCDDYLLKLSTLIENAMLDHPFSFGSYQRVKRGLQFA